MSLQAEQIRVWGLVIVAESRVAELQRWSNEEQIDTQAGPKGILRHLEAKGDKIFFYYKKGRLEWSLTDGSCNQHVYGEKESCPTDDIVFLKPKRPQFIGNKNWCCVLTDGGIKICHPSKLFHDCQRNWKELPASKRASLVGAPVLKTAGTQVWRSLKVACVASLALASAAVLAMHFLG